MNRDLSELSDEDLRRESMRIHLEISRRQQRTSLELMEAVANSDVVRLPFGYKLRDRIGIVPFVLGGACLAVALFLINLLERWIHG